MAAISAKTSMKLSHAAVAAAAGGYNGNGINNAMALAYRRESVIKLNEKLSKENINGVQCQ
jgi:hypothetical protein